jgi:hypothetical protein
MKSILPYLLLFTILFNAAQLLAQNTRQYVNPVQLDAIAFNNSKDGKGHRSVADPQVTYNKGKYYMAATGGGDAKGLFWVSDD